MIDGTAIQKVADLSSRPVVVGESVAVPAGWTMKDPASLVQGGPLAATLEVSTLTAIRDFLVANRDALNKAGLVVHVVSPNTVTLLGPLSEKARTREVFLKATATDLTAGFLGKMMSLEEFIVGLQARFQSTDDQMTVLRLFSNVKHEAVKTATDDGISQTVTTKAGVALVTDVTVPSQINLTPYRTFREVLQPTSTFLVRLQAGRSGGLPEVGLFESDGGAWRLTAISRVRDWLVTELGPEIAVIG